MVRERKVSIAALNIVLQPHTTQLYLDLFNFVQRRKISGSINANKRAYISLVKSGKEYGFNDCVYGNLRFYTDIDTNKDWLDLEKDDKAENKDLITIKAEAKRFKSEFKVSQFIFNAKNHIFYFVFQNGRDISISPKSVNKVMESIFAENKVFNKFGEISVTTLPQKDALEKIFLMPILRKIEIDLLLPNPDDLAKMEKKFNLKLERMNASRLKQEITKDKRKESIRLDQETKNLARVAAKNGRVTGVGFDNSGDKLEESTEKHPWVISFKYRPQKEAIIFALFKIVKKLFSA